MISTKNNKIVDFKEIESIGGDELITFKILPSFIVENYHGNKSNGVAFEKLRISEAGKILII